MKVSRRSFLVGGASVAVAAIPAPLPAVEAIENPALIEVSQKLPHVLRDYKAALARYTRAIGVFEAKAPTVPQCLVSSNKNKLGYYVRGEQETDVEGNTVSPPDVVRGGKTYAHPRRQIFTAKNIHDEILRREKKSSPDAKMLRFLRRRLAIAEKFERERSGLATHLEIAALVERREDTARALVSLAGVAGREKANTMLGVTIKARTFSTLSEITHSGVNQHRYITAIYGHELCCEIVSIMGGTNQ